MFLLYRMEQDCSVHAHLIWKIKECTTEWKTGCNLTSKCALPCQRYTDSLWCSSGTFFTFTSGLLIDRSLGLFWMKMARSKFAAKRKVNSDNRHFREDQTEQFAFIPPPTSQEAIAVTIFPVNEAKHWNLVETFVQNSELRTTKINALKSSSQASSVTDTKK